MLPIYNVNNKGLEDDEIDAIEKGLNYVKPKIVFDENKMPILTHCVGRNYNHTDDDIWYGFCYTAIAKDTRCEYCYNKLVESPLFKPMFKIKLLNTHRISQTISCDSIDDWALSSIQVDDFQIRVLNHDKTIPFFATQDQAMTDVFNVEMPHNTDFCIQVRHNERETFFGKSETYFTMNINTHASPLRFYSKAAYAHGFTFNAADTENVVNVTLAIYKRNPNAQSWFGHNVIHFLDHNQFDDSSTCYMVYDHSNGYTGEPITNKPLEPPYETCLKTHTYDSFIFIKRFTVSFHMYDPHYTDKTLLSDSDDEMPSLCDACADRVCTEHHPNDTHNVVINADGIIPANMNDTVPNNNVESIEIIPTIDEHDDFLII